MAICLLAAALIGCAALTGQADGIRLGVAALGLAILPWRAGVARARIPLDLFFALAAYSLGMVQGGWAGTCTAAAGAYACKCLAGSQGDWASARPGVFMALAAMGVGMHVGDSDVVLGAAICCAMAIPAVDVQRALHASVPSWGQLAGIVLVVLVGALMVVRWGWMDPVQRTLVLEAGKWGNPSPKMAAGAPLDQRHAYSYSWLAGLLSAEACSALTPVALEGADELFIVTPTQPFSQAEAEALEAWVASGGHLVLVVDHTDLFGHGRVAQAVLRPFGMSNGLTAFFPMRQLDPVDITWSAGHALKTAVPVHGVLGESVASARWVEERADYGARNFFGPLRASDDDRFGRQPVGVTSRHGRGQVTVWGDSTIFANFAVFQPGNLDMLAGLRSPRLSSRCGLVLLALFLAWLPFCTGVLWRIQAALVFLTAACGLVTAREPALAWPQGSLAVAGDPGCVIEDSDPSMAVSTAFAALPAFGVVPRWVSGEQVASAEAWIGAGPPPRPHMRWISMERVADAASAVAGPAPRLREGLGMAPVSDWPCEGLQPSVWRAGGIWTDDVVGDFWFDEGVSKAKRVRLEAFAAAVAGHPLPCPVQAHVSGNDLCRVRVTVSGSEPYVDEWPCALFSSVGDEHCLGSGLSVRVVEWEGAKALVVPRQFIEGRFGGSGVLVVRLP